MQIHTKVSLQALYATRVHTKTIISVARQLLTDRLLSLTLNPFIFKVNLAFSETGHKPI